MLLLVIALLPFVTNQGGAAGVQDVQAHARAVLSALTSRDYQAVVREFNDQR